MVKYALTLLTSLLFYTICYGQPKPDSLKESNRLVSKLSMASQLYSSQEGDLDLATKLLGGVAYSDARFYRQTDLFYFLSLEQSSFDSNPKALKEEARRIMPLLGDSLRFRWESLIKNRNDELTSKITKFWDSRDPVLSTKYNERLFEHWYRIRYAQEHFTRNSEPPYGTDDRGLIYVRFGAPDFHISRTLRAGPIWLRGLREVKSFNLLHKAEDTEYILWQYNTSPTSNNVEHYYLFGKKNGREEFGLRKDAVELLNLSYIELQIPRAGSKVRLYQQLYTYKIFKELAIFNPDYSDIYTEIEDAVNMSLAPVLTFRSSTPIESMGSEIQHQTTQRRKDVPSSSTQLLEKIQLESSYQFYRFLNKTGDTEFALAIEPDLSEIGPSHTDLLLNTVLNSYPPSKENKNRSQQATRLSPNSLQTTSVHIVDDESYLNNPSYYSMELIDPTEASIAMPANIGLNPRIIGATGQQKIIFPAPLSNIRPFTISDIILTHNQKPQNDQRIPVAPTLDRTFNEDQKVMIFFETYELPKGGYKFEYYFEQRRALLGNKKVEEKPSVTVIRDKIPQRDEQLFSINLSDLKPAKYNLVFTFSPLSEKANSSTKTKRIELTVME